MNALVVYESMFGNTRLIAEAVVDGLAAAHLTVTSVEVAAAPSFVPGDVGLLVVGGPTHAFGMSRPGTRRSAADQADQPLVSTGSGVREWLAALPRGRAGLAAAAFDTRINKPRLPGSAARAVRRRLRRLGFTL
ncbi:MAG TPA: flavodoxin, partial [Micromonosporaceae bacterium]|nr:flavodoxin [Micromonosporaceae bacterium]